MLPYAVEAIAWDAQMMLSAVLSFVQVHTVSNVKTILNVQPLASPDALPQTTPAFLVSQTQTVSQPQIDQLAIPQENTAQDAKFPLLIVPRAECVPSLFVSSAPSQLIAHLVNCVESQLIHVFNA
jgi:hypothetical protein